MDTGNPVYPLGYRVFRGPAWSEAREAQWQHAHGPKAATLNALGNSLVDVAGRSDWQSPLYLAFAPLALIRPGIAQASSGAGGIRGISLSYLVAADPPMDRFWLPLLPCLAMLAGLGADWSTSWSWRMLRGTILVIAVGL